MSSKQPVHTLTDATDKKLIHLALPLRLTHLDGGDRGAIEMACTYDIHPRGARLLSGKEVRVGDLLQVERGRNRAVCQVIWTAAPDSLLRGQFTVECMDQAKAPWDDELKQLQEQYLPILNQEEMKRLSYPRNFDLNKRRRPRFHLDGAADVFHLDGDRRLEGTVNQLSELGCLIRASGTLQPGSELKVSLSIFDVSMALRGQVKYCGEETGMGVEFTEIRQGDRPLLNYVLSALAAEQKSPSPTLAALAVAG